MHIYISSKQLKMSGYDTDFRFKGTIRLKLRNAVQKSENY